MKTERVTLLTSPEFKSFLTKDARSEGISVAELVRSRCEGRQGVDQAMLATLMAELRGAVKQAKATLKRGLDETNAVMADLRAKQGKADQSVPQRQSRKIAGTRV